MNNLVARVIGYELPITTTLFVCNMLDRHVSISRIENRSNVRYDMVTYSSIDGLWLESYLTASDAILAATIELI